MNIVPQLAESIDKAKLPDFLPDDRYCFEQKLDGIRKLVWIRDGRVEILQRDGNPEGKDTPAAVWSQLSNLSTGPHLALDCELVEDCLWVFDLPFAAPSADAEPFVHPKKSYAYRRDVLDRLAPVIESDNVKVLPTARTMDEKMALAKMVIQAGGEGLMVKDSTAVYVSGKRHTGLLKAKFVKDVDAIITRFNVGISPTTGRPKDNCELAVFNDKGELTVIGECIIHPKERNQVDVGSVVTVAYLYVKNPDAPRLVQPTRIRVRDDKAAAECTLDQLRVTDLTVHTW